ncbi:MAG: SDR family NAD(P)-dependent oxidoreductase, partial [Phycisphaerae bacterium]
MTDLTDQAVLITGASTGIGAASAVALAEAGCDVGINYCQNPKSAEHVKRKVESLGRRAELFQCDVCDPAAVTEMVDAFAEQFGRVDIVFANAGGLVERCAIADMSDRLWQRTMALNLDSVFYTVRAALPHMFRVRRGNIIINSSVAGRTGGGGHSVHYAAAKGALFTLVKGLAKEVAGEGIRVNAVGPGVTDTPFHEKYTEPARMQEFWQSIPVGKLGEVEDIARCIVWLAGET